MRYFIAELLGQTFLGKTSFRYRFLCTKILKNDGRSYNTIVVNLLQRTCDFFSCGFTMSINSIQDLRVAPPQHETTVCFLFQF